MELLSACQSGYVNKVKSVLAAGADVNQKDPQDGISGLMLASIFGKIEIVEVLIKAGINVNAQIDDGATALVYAIEAGHTSVVPNYLQPVSMSTLATRYVLPR